MRIGERFEARQGTRRASLRLAAVQPLASGPQTEQFTLVFDAPAGPTMAGLNLLRHANGQQLAVYLEPGERRLVAHFNRLA